MRIDNVTLRRIIKEELSNVLLEEEISNIQNLDEGLGSTFALMMGLWSGMAGDDNSLTVIDTNGEIMELSQEEFKKGAEIMDRLSNGANKPAIDKSIEVMQGVDASAAGPTAGTLDLRDVYEDNAANVMNAVFHKVDNSSPSPEMDQPEGSTSSHSVNIDGMMKMIDLDLKTNKVERAKERAQKLLDDSPAGMSPEQKQKLTDIINS